MPRSVSEKWIEMEHCIHALTASYTQSMLRISLFSLLRTYLNISVGVGVVQVSHRIVGTVISQLSFMKWLKDFTSLTLKSLDYISQRRVQNCHILWPKLSKRKMKKKINKEILRFIPAELH